MRLRYDFEKSPFEKRELRSRSLFNFNINSRNQFGLQTIAILPLRTEKNVFVCVRVIYVICATLMDWLRAISLINEIVLQLARAGTSYTLLCGFHYTILYAKCDAK